MNRKIPCVCGVWGLGFGCVWVCDSVAFDGFGDGFRGTALVLGKHRPPYGFDIHQLVQELKPLVVRLVGTQEPVCDALLTGFAPFRHAVEGSVVEGGHGGDCTLCVGGKGVGHVCVGNWGHRRLTAFRLIKPHQCALHGVRHGARPCAEPEPQACCCAWTSERQACSCGRGACPPWCWRVPPTNR